MTGTVVWWTWLEDGVAHAVPFFQPGQPRGVVTTMCGRMLFRHRLERDEGAPHCLLCRMRVGPG
ncbi:hypothetical protein GCM10027184_10580 [Saccharothrix stipae]